MLEYSVARCWMPVLSAIASSTGIQERATLYSSTEFKKVRMLYFTEDFKRWEAEHGS